MENLTGVYTTKRKDGSLSYRSSITYNNKHISLGSYSTAIEAHQTYLEGKAILVEQKYSLYDYGDDCLLSFEKWVVLHNFRDNGYYIKNPIYLHKFYFSYYLDPETELKFDVDDLFYYSNHKIFRRQGYLFVNDYGMQVNILSRYGIKNHGVLGKDYVFLDGDPHNFMYHNIEVINPYYGVSKIYKGNQPYYLAKIHIHGDYIIGRYHTVEEAAVAYNKAVDYLRHHKAITIKYTKNYIPSLSAPAYKALYEKLTLSPKLKLI